MNLGISKVRVFFPSVSPLLILFSLVRLLTVMNTIQDKLSHLEDENGISRRRVRELEHELEMCKKDVARERTRVLHKEGELERAVADARRSVKDVKGKGKARARDTSMSMQEADASVRYKEAVEEKKGRCLHSISHAMCRLIITFSSGIFNNNPPFSPNSSH